MAQETWALKLDAELKEKLQSIIKEDFESSKEFMEQLVSLYEIDKLKQGGSVINSEIATLESLTKRINDVFIGVNAKINTMLEVKEADAISQMASKQNLIERLQSDLAKLEEEKEQISSINDSLVNSNNEYKQEVNQLTKSNQTLEELVAEYREKNDMLTGTLTEYKADREQNKALVAQVNELQAKLNELNSAATEQAKQILESDVKLQEQAEKHIMAIGELKAKHITELETVKAKAEIDANMKTLELQKEFQKKLQEIQEKHNNEIMQYQAKYKELLDKLEQKGTVKAKPSKAKGTTNNDIK